MNELRSDLESSTFLERGVFEEGNTILHYAVQVRI